MAKQDLAPHDSTCPITERPHQVKVRPDADLLQCEACQDLFPIPEGWEDQPAAPPDAQDLLESAAVLQGGPEVVGRVSVDPEGKQAFVELTPDGLRRLMTAIVREMATTQIPVDLPHMIAMTMLGTMYLKQLGMDYNNIMQVVSLAWNGDVTGLFVLTENPESTQKPS